LIRQRRCRPGRLDASPGEVSRDDLGDQLRGERGSGAAFGTGADLGLPQDRDADVTVVVADGGLAGVADDPAAVCVVADLGRSWNST